MFLTMPINVLLNPLLASGSLNPRLVDQMTVSGDEMGIFKHQYLHMFGLKLNKYE